MPDTPAPLTRPGDILKAVRDKIPCLARPRRPLAIGIGPVLTARIVELTGVESRLAGYAVGFHTRSEAYLRGCREGASRVDMDGNPVGTVTAEEAAYAAMRLEAALRRARAQEQALAGEQVKAAATAPAPTPTPMPTLRKPRVNPVTGRPILTLRRAGG